MKRQFALENVLYKWRLHLQTSIQAHFCCNKSTSYFVELHFQIEETKMKDNQNDRIDGLLEPRTSTDLLRKQKIPIQTSYAMGIIILNSTKTPRTFLQVQSECRDSSFSPNILRSSVALKRHWIKLQVFLRSCVKLLPPTWEFRQLHWVKLGPELYWLIITEIRRIINQLLINDKVLKLSKHTTGYFFTVDKATTLLVGVHIPMALLINGPAPNSCCTPFAAGAHWLKIAEL